jgi:phenylpropionate dioxygenase-like ring-hydroxylating dioxygenase large terminal subunit
VSALPVEGSSPDAATPVAVTVDGLRAVAWTDADGRRRVARDVCPHRRAPLSAGRVEDGHLTCAYHGWSFDGSGTCRALPAVGPGGRIPNRARLDMLDVAPDDGPLPRAGPVDACPAIAADSTDWLDADTPGLDRFWHPVARRDEIGPDGTLEVELLGEHWIVDTLAAAAAPVGAPAGRTAWGVAEHLDHVWLAPTEPLAPLPPVDEWGGDGWHHRTLRRAEGRFGAGLLVDNQLDAAHFPFLHAESFGNPAGAELPPSEVERRDASVTSTMRVAITAANDHRAAPGERTSQAHRTMRYRWEAPLWLYLRLDYEEMGGSTVIVFSVTPLAAGRARMDVDLLFSHPDGFTEAELDDRVAFEHQVVSEDLDLQRRFEDLRLPLDPTAELHTRADRLSVTVRQALRSLLTDAAAAT